MVARRSLANWRLLSSVVIGVVLASTIMAGTVIYFDSLRDLALESALERHDPRDLDILAKTTKGPTNAKESAAVRGFMELEYERRIGWLLEDTARGARTATFFMTAPGDEENAGTDNARAYFLFLDGVESHVELLPGGRMPTDLPQQSPSANPIALEALIPEAASIETGLGVGDRLSAIPHWQDATPHASVEITGVYRRLNDDNPMWRLNDEAFHTFSSGSFLAAPLLVSESTMLSGLGGAFTDMDSTYGWMLMVDHTRLRATNATDARRDVVGLQQAMSRAFLSYRQQTILHTALADYDQRLLFTRLQMFVVLILIAVVVLYYVVTLSALVAEQRKNEISLLQGRGATERHVLTVFVLEGATIAALAIAIAPFLAALSISLLGLTPAFSDLSGGSTLPVTLTRGAFVMSAIGGVLSFCALMIPAFEASRSPIARDRQEASRPSQLSFFQRYYLDVLLLVVSLVLFRQLTKQGSLAATNLLGEVAVNQLLLAVPAITLVASAMVLLRIFPVVMGLASRLLARRLPPGLVMGLWQMARNPTHYARLALLLILMAGLGIFAASFGGTLQRNFTERVLYSAGADIRLTNVSINTRGASRPMAKQYEDMDAITAASPALRAIGSHLGQLGGDTTFDVLAVDTARFYDVAWFRDDFSDEPLPELMQDIAGYDLSLPIQLPDDLPDIPLTDNIPLPDAAPGIQDLIPQDEPLPGLMEGIAGGVIPLGIPLPDNARAIQALVKADRAHPSVILGVRLRDSNGRYFSFPMGFLESSNWRLYGAELFEGGNPRFRLFPARPFTLVSIGVLETDLERGLDPGSLLIDTIRVRLSTGEIEALEDFREGPAGWNTLGVSATAGQDRMRASEVSARGDGSLMFAWAAARSQEVHGVSPGPEPEAIPALVSPLFMREFGHSVGDEILVSISGRRLNVRIADTVDFFPTLDSYDDKFLVADLAAVRAHANLGMARGEITPNEMWLRTDSTGDDRAALIERLRNGRPFQIGRAIDTETDLAVAQIDPLVLAGWRALLLIAFGAILVLSSLGFLVHAYISFRNRELQFALMRTMGFSTRQLVSLMWLEQALVIAVGMALGTWMGGRLGETVMPFLSHDERGGRALPPFVIEVGWQNLLVTYVAMGVIFTAIILGVIWFIRRMSLSRVLRLGDGG